MTLTNIDLALVHGVNTGPTFPYGREWLEAIATHLIDGTVGFNPDHSIYWIRGHTPALREFYITAREIRWPSQDSPVRDWLGLRFSPSYREDSLAVVRGALADWIRHPPGVGTHRIVVAHSMGVPLALEAYWAMLEEEGPAPSFLGFGSPLTHPIMGRLLEHNGLGQPPLTPKASNISDGLKLLTSDRAPVVLSNKGDFICALWSPFGNIWRTRPYFERVSVKIDAKPTREHDADKYLKLPEAWSRIARSGE